MTRQQSSSELAGSLAATLTPRAPSASTQLSRASQNSGLFDVRALYAETLNEVMRRTRSDARLVSLARTAQPTWPRATRWSPPARAFEPDVVAPPAFNNAPLRESTGLGWFGVAVAWLATVTMGVAIATTLPGHALTRLRLGPMMTMSAMRAPHAAGPAMVAPSVSVVATAVSPAAVISLPLAPVAAPALPTGALALASPARTIAPQSDAPHVSTKRPPPKSVTSVGHVRPAAPATGPSATPATSSIAVAPRAPAASRPRPSTPPVSTNVSTAGMSLDELIRHEVQVESAKHH